MKLNESEKLAFELWRDGICIPNNTESVCRKYYINDSHEGCVKCWIEWAKNK